MCRLSRERVVRVRLVADTAEYQAAMKRAAKAARKLSRRLREVNEATVRVGVERG